MFNSSVVDVGIGLIFVYLILGLMCTTVNEWIAQFLKLRAKTLKEGIRVMLSGLPDQGPEIAPEEISPLHLLNKLAEPGNKLAAALGLDHAAIADYRARLANDVAVARSLADRLNAALDDPALHQKIDIGKVSARVLAAVRKPLSGKKLQLANRALLREAYTGVAGLAHSFYNHSLVRSLAKPGEHPSYIPGRTFAAALIDVLQKAATAPNGQDGEKAGAWDSITASIEALPDSDTKRSLLLLAQDADHQIAAFQKNIETWFEDTMDRVSGWYKNKTQLITVLVACCVTIFANADTVQIARKLFLNPTVREKIAQEASAASRAGEASTAKPASLTPQQKADLGELTGWSTEFRTFHQLQSKRDGHPGALPPEDDTFPGVDLLRDQSIFWPWLWAIAPGHLIGWFLTAVAASLGAPFWFDTLNKFMNVRAAGTAPNEKGSDASKA